MLSSLFRESLQQKGERVDKDQIKEIIMDLRSRGLSFQKISDILRELHSVDLNRETVRIYFKESIKKASVKVQNDIDTGTNKVEPIKEVNPATTQEPIKAQVSKDNMQEQSIKNVQPFRKVRYPGFEDEDLRKDPHYGWIPRDYLGMTPEQRYEYHLERVKQNRKERNRTILHIILYILLWIGVVLFIWKYGIIR